MKLPPLWPAFWHLVLVKMCAHQAAAGCGGVTFMGDLHVMISELEEAGKSKVRTHHSGYLQGKRWNKGQRRKSTGKVIQKQVVGSCGREHEGGWRATLPA